MAATVRGASRRPKPLELLVVLAPILVELALVALPPLGEHGWYRDALVSQSSFALAPLAVVLSGSYWASIGLSRSGLAPSLTLGVLLSLVVVLPQLVLILLGISEPGSLIDEPRLFLGLPLALALYLTFWGVFEGIWMSYLLFTFDRWLSGDGALRWRALFFAALWFALIHAFTQAVAFDASLPQILIAAARGGVALLIPGSIAKVTGNGWGLILWFTATNLGMPSV